MRQGGERMFFNALGEKVSRRRYREMLNAARTRRELMGAGLTSRRDLFKMGLLTSTGMLVAKNGLSSRAWAQSQQFQQGVPNLCAGAGLPASPPTRSFVAPLPIMPIAQTVSSLSPAPTIAPNTAAGEVRAAPHQAPGLEFPFPPPKLYRSTQQAIHVSQPPALPLQPIWGFNDGFHASSPGPTYAAHYGVPQLTRNINALPPLSQNGGFWVPSTTTHLHNSHNPSENDRNPCDFF